MSKGHDINTCACITCDIDREILVMMKNRVRKPGEPVVTVKSEFPDVEEFVAVLANPELARKEPPSVIYVEPEMDEDDD